MKLRAVYSFRFDSRAPDWFPESFEFTLGSASVRCVGLTEDRSTAIVHVEVDANPHTLERRPPPEPLGEESGKLTFYVPEQQVASAVAMSTARLLSLALPLRVRPPAYAKSYELLPETEDDRDLLDKLCTRSVFEDLRGSIGAVGIHFDLVDDAILNRLAEREVGIALYLDAIWADNPVSRYRDLWRVLESAFSAKKQKLLRLLGSYGPAQALGFDRHELKELYHLRGRASHAESRAGLHEYNTVAAETARRSGRLRSLAEVVLITKATWGSESLETEPLAKLRSYRKRDGTLVFFRNPANFA